MANPVRTVKRSSWIFDRHGVYVKKKLLPPVQAPYRHELIRYTGKLKSLLSVSP